MVKVDPVQPRSGNRATSKRRIGARLAAGTLGFCILAACSGSDDPASQAASQGTDAAADDQSANPTESGVGTPETAGAPSEASDPAPEGAPDDCGTSEPTEVAGGESVQLETVSEADGLTVSAAVYPLADTEGNPWSQWGQGVVLPDGRYVSAVGDHLGVDGTSWFYEFDPETNELTRTTEVSEALDHLAGDWGYGKIHAPMVLSECGDVITATYWGTRRDLVLGESYRGDHLIRYDTTTREITSLGVPIEGYGIPSIAISADRQWIFGEAVDPESDPDAGTFFVAAAETGEVVHRVDDEDHVGFRSLLVTPEGTAMFAAGGADLTEVDPESGSTTAVDDVLPGDWLRAASEAAPDGSVYGATRDPDELFKREPDGSFTDLGPLEDYVASVALAPDGETLYYVPGAHGSGWEYGTPLVAVDLDSGERSEIVLLNDVIEDGLGVRVGGTYNIVVDPTGERIYVGLNAGPIDDEEDAFGQVVLAVVELP